jgi:UDP:flavonoid glycosyltransferase YjiC (YdhE family)
MRVLVTSTANAGHFAPLRPVLDALANRRHELLVVAPPGLAEQVRDAGYPYRPGGEPPAAEVAAIWDRVATASRDEAAILVNREIFGRLDTEAMLPSVEGVCDDWRPDLVVHEPAEFASAVVAERRGLRQIQVAIGLARVEGASVVIARPALERYGAGLVSSVLAAPYVTRFPASLDPSPYPSTHRFRESAPGSSPLPDWWSGSDAPLVYISFGTVAGRLPIGPAVYRAATRAAAGLPARVLLTMGRTRAATVVGEVPPNLHVEPWVDQSAALAAADVVVCHGGAGTTFGALAAGRPVVVVPLMADQPTNARLVASAGAGLVVPPEAPTGDAAAETALAARLRAAIQRLLDDPSFTAAARSVGAEMNALPDLEDVLDRVVVAGDAPGGDVAGSAR